MFRFEHGEYLYALIAIPILIVFFVAAWLARKQALKKFGELEALQRLMPSASNFMHILKFVFLVVGLFFLIIGWANPQWGTKKEKVKRKSVDVFLALDISQSMLAEDISPSRMDRAKKFAQNLVQALKGERIGTIIFAGNAYMQVPLTTDYAAANLFINSANPSMAPSQGTAIVDAIDLAEQSFEEENKNHKVLIIISDGENHDDEALAGAKKAGRNGLLIYTIGVGTKSGGFIPSYERGVLEFKKDGNGDPVRTFLNETMLEDLADAGNGTYFNLLSGSDRVSTALKNRINQMEKREFEQRIFSQYESYFQYFIGIGLLLLILEFLFPYRKISYFADTDLFKS